MSVVNNPGDLDLAIIGMSGRFPGAGSVDELWQGLMAGREHTAPRVVERRGGTARIALTNMPHDPFAFDAAFFGMRPREAMLTDPQHRVFLECCYHALEHAGYPPGSHDRIVGIYASSYLNTYLLDRVLPFVRMTAGEADLPTLVGNEKDHLATLVAWKLGLRGPAISVQTACSSSHVALHLACESLSAFQCDLALAGGVTLSLWQCDAYEHREGELTSEDGHCRPFDARASGTVYCNGAAVVVLKRLSDALADQDEIYAIIKGTAVNNDADRRSGYAVPSVEGQVEVIEQALSIARVPAEQIAFVEGHGTGTRLGDEIEVEALHRVLRSGKSASCALGSLKANLGHLGVASGVAGIIKASLALYHRVFPPQINLHTPLRRLSGGAAALYVSTMPVPLQSGTVYAGVSSFGLGGTNAHVVLSSGPPRGSNGPPRATPGLVFPLSAKTPQALRTLIERMSEVLPNLSPDSLHRASATLWHRREVFPVRECIVASDPATLTQTLSAARRRAVRATAATERPHVVVMLPTCRAAADALARADPAVAARSHALLGEAARDADGLDVNAVARGFAVQVALVERLLAHGVRPSTLIGEGSGEIAALYVAGVLSLQHCIRALVVMRSQASFDLISCCRQWFAERMPAMQHCDVILGQDFCLRRGEQIGSALPDIVREEAWQEAALLRCVSLTAAIFIEVGGPGMFSRLFQTYRGQLAGLGFCSVAQTGETSEILSALAMAWRAGCSVDWPMEKAHPISLPSYPFDRGWYEIAASGQTLHRAVDLDGLIEELEDSLQDLWHEIFGAVGVGPNDTLYEHGADSVTIVVYARSLRHLFGVEIPLLELQSDPTFTGHVQLVRGQLLQASQGDAPTAATGAGPGDQAPSTERSR